MRRVPVLVLTLIAGMSLTAAADENGNYLDKFNSVSWGGSDGSLPWQPDWTEMGDNGDPSSGDVAVLGNGNCSGGGKCVQLSSRLASVGIERAADTSAFEEELELRFKIQGTGLVGGTIRAEVFDGVGWKPVWEHVFVSAFSQSVTRELDEAYGTPAFRVRFVYAGTGVGGNVYIDDVELRGELGYQPPTTTTTSTTTSTTTTTVPTTTTTPPTTTSTHAPSTTRPTTTTTEPVTTTQPGADDGEGTAVAPTVTTTSSTTPTTIVPDGDDDDQPPSVVASGGGIRPAARGVQADFDGALFPEVRTLDQSIAGVDLDVRFAMAVEVIEASWAWMGILGVVIAWSAITGLDRKAKRQHPPVGRVPA